MLAASLGVGVFVGWVVTQVLAASVAAAGLWCCGVGGATAVGVGGPAPWSRQNRVSPVLPAGRGAAGVCCGRHGVGGGG